MKKVIAIFVIVLASSLNSNAQDKMMKKEMGAKTVTLEQTKGKFTQQNLTLTKGNYIFEISNNNVGHDVGFVLVKKGDDASKPENHIKTAYITNVVKNNTKGQSNITTLEKGEYVYFCPLNPTPQYTLTVK